ncbi:hypothetical protein LRP52_01000 [Photobacterium sp. ZSDE20]|uniref:Uncharacterized protein n=1 Tax=Photobacterium pectinilyticum TaxID=2906793 RepID=A0ABT1MVW7_9GAMM|nr:hypothetical protein [Photobacterium sp. ZSDE20]MCQ1056641.1 hypothetical protein [Photobacterium sp. ZSDE20]MDD1820777.1 hypothetical protein [Photobacterium sp. ZSDE20]
MKKALLASCLILLTGCFDDKDEDKSWRLNTKEITEIIEFRNGVSIHGYLQNKATVRWNTEHPVPLYFVSQTEGKVPANVSEAIDLIHSAIGFKVFSVPQVLYHPLSDYRDDVLNISNNQFDEHFYATHEIDFGVVIGHDTQFSLLSEGQNDYCVGTSNQPFSSQLLTYFAPDTHYYQEDQVIWVHVGHPRCNQANLTPEVIANELLRSLGLPREFLVGDWWLTEFSGPAQQLIRTLYNNPAGTPFSELK